jgi:hypothetical protein
LIPSAHVSYVFDESPYWPIKQIAKSFFILEVPFCGYKMYVAKRDGRQEPVRFDKITARLKKLSYGLSVEHCDPVLVAQKVCAGLFKGITTTQVDELATETAAAMTTNHPDYALVGICD